MEIKSKSAAYCVENIIYYINITSVRSASSFIAHTAQKIISKNWPLKTPEYSSSFLYLSKLSQGVSTLIHYRKWIKS